MAPPWHTRALNSRFGLEPPKSGSHVVELAGESSTWKTAPEVGDFLARLSGSVKVDCSRFTFIDASAVRILLQAAACLASLQLTNVTPAMRQALQLTDTTSLLQPEGDGDVVAIPALRSIERCCVLDHPESSRLSGSSANVPSSKATTGSAVCVGSVGPSGNSQRSCK